MSEETTKDKKERTLTPKLRAFVEVYLTTWNATKAAEIVGYKKPNQAQYGILRTPGVADAIAARMEEMKLKANEVMARIAEQATCNQADFYNFETLASGEMRIKSVNWGEVYRRGHLVKKISYNRNGDPVLEFYDAQNALMLVGKNLKLFQDSVGLEFLNALKGYVGVSPEDWDKENAEQK